MSMGSTSGRNAIDGSNSTLGSKGDPAYTDVTGAAAGSEISLLKGLFVAESAGGGGGGGSTGYPADGGVTGSLSAISGPVLTMTCPGAQSSWVVEISNNFTGTLTFTESFDGGTNYEPVLGRQVGTSVISSTHANNTSPTVVVYRGNLAGATHFQVQMTVFTSGTANLTLRRSAGVEALAITNVVQQNLTQVNGQPHGVANPVFAQITNQAVGALLYSWNGGAPASQFYDRLRSVLSLKYMTATISSGGTQGSAGPIITTANPTGLQCSQWIWLLGGTTEQVLTGPVGSYTPGSSTIPITSSILNTSHTSIAYLAYDPLGAGPNGNTFLWDSILPYALALNNNGKGILAQGDANGNLLTMPGGVSSTAIAAGATGPTVIKNSAGTYYGALVTSTGAGVPLGYDNASAASGKIIVAIAASAAIGTRDASTPAGESFANGLTFAGGGTMPGLTIFWS